MNCLISRIFSARVQRDPFPYFVVDDALDRYLVEEAVKRWPDKRFFGEGDVYGRRTLSLPDTLDMLPKEDKLFWKFLVDEICSMVVYGAVTSFAPFLQRKFKGPNSLRYDSVGLTEIDDEASEFYLTPHCHFWTNPVYVFTILLYLGAQEDTNGTTLYGVEGGLYTEDGRSRLAELASRSYEYETHAAKVPADLLPQRRVEFRPNRLLCVLDSAASFHGVELWRRSAGSPSGTRQRKLLRFHIAAPSETCSEVFGLPLESFQRVARSVEERPLFERLCARDIETIAAVDVAPTPGAADIDYANRFEIEPMVIIPASAP